MSQSLHDEHLSDDEVFFGKLSLKEIKKHILWNEHNFNTKHVHDSPTEKYDSIQIIQTHSAPNLIQKHTESTLIKEAVSSLSLSPSGPETYSNWNVKPVNDSFLKVEKMVADMCVSPEHDFKKDELNNTLDIIDYILKNGSPEVKKKDVLPEELGAQITSYKTNEINIMKMTTPSAKQGKLEKDPLILKTESKIEGNNYEKNIIETETPNTKQNKLKETPIIHKTEAEIKPVNLTPAKNAKQLNTEKLSTPSCVKQRTPLFKTPGNTLFSKRPSVTSLKKTPIKFNTYQHIASPVASYIKNCPVAPLVKEVRPTRPLLGASSIPKFVKNPVLVKQSKENINLPSVAYKSAKKTQVIDVPDAERLPQTQSMKKITSSLPKPLIMKHNHREMNLAKRILVSRQEDSFADLSLRQADVSVCTQKSAFNKPK